MKLIVAVDSKYGISKNNDIPWKDTTFFKTDIKFFKNVTTLYVDHPIVIMGKNTYLSLNNKHLKDRTNIVVSSTLDSVQYPFIRFSSLRDIFTCSINIKQDDIFIIGGSKLYKETLKDLRTTHVIISIIDNDYNCDNYFPYDLMLKMGFSYNQRETAEYMYKYLPYSIQHKVQVYTKY